jgi:hypothetical protein
MSGHTIRFPVRYVGKPKKERVPIDVDTREQKPFVFDPEYVIVTQRTLPTFDYSVKDDLQFAVERKSIDDLYKSFSSPEKWGREQDKIRRAAAAFHPYPIIYLVEGQPCELTNLNYGHFGGVVTPQLIWSRISILMMKGVQFVWCTSKRIASYQCYLLLKRRWRDMQKE